MYRKKTEYWGDRREDAFLLWKAFNSLIVALDKFLEKQFKGKFRKLECEYKVKAY